MYVVHATVATRRVSECCQTELGSSNLLCKDTPFSPLHADVDCGRQAEIVLFFPTIFEIQIFIIMFGFSLKRH